MKKFYKNWTTWADFIDKLNTVLAPAMGLSFDTETSILYAGDDNTTGFQFVPYNSSTSTYGYIYGITNGTQQTATKKNWATSGASISSYYFWYEVGKNNSILFGFTTSYTNDNFSFAIGKISDFDGNDKDYGYIIIKNSSDPGYIFTKDYFRTFSSIRYEQTNASVNIFNIYDNVEGKFYFPSIYTFEQGFCTDSSSNTSVKFKLNDKYYRCSQTTSSYLYKPIIIEIDE